MNQLFLKEFTYQYILLHDNLTKDEKLQVGQFVKEASEEQVMALLLSGECKKELREKEGEFVRELFDARINKSKARINKIMAAKKPR